VILRPDRIQCHWADSAIAFVEMLGLRPESGGKFFDVFFVNIFKSYDLFCKGMVNSFKLFDSLYQCFSMRVKSTIYPD